MKKKLLFISDQNESSNHSFVEGVINSYLTNYFQTYTIYFEGEKTSDEKTLSIKENKIILPLSVKNHPLKFLIKHCSSLKDFDLNDLSYIIVRNNFKALKEVINNKNNYSYKIGFQLSFPHSYRRLHQAYLEKKGILRKKLGYFFARHKEKYLINKCDIFFPISQSMKEEFFEDVKIDYLPLPLGIKPQEANCIEHNQDNGRKFKFIYAGTIDKLRKLDVVFDAVDSIDGDFEFVVFTKDDKYAKTLIKNKNSKILINSSIDRKELFGEMAKSDAGIFLLPNDKLYKISSPTKVMEYYSCGIPCLMSKVDECLELFEGEDCGIFCDFDEKSIKTALENILSIPREKLQEMGKKGCQILLEKRNYEKIAQNLYEALQKLEHN